MQSGELWREMLLRERIAEARKLGMSVPDLEDAKLLADAVEESGNAAAAAGEGDRVSVNKHETIPTTVKNGLRAAQKDVQTADLKAVTAADGMATSTSTSTHAVKKDEGDQSSDEEGEGDDEVGLEETPRAQYRLGLHFASALDLSADFVSSSDANTEVIWMKLPEDLTYYCWTFLCCIDMVGNFNLICRRSRTVRGGLFHVNEKVCMYLCNQIFPRQFHLQRKKKLRLLRYPTWQHMAILRPRLRTNGFYSLRTLYSKPPCNDMFWEEKKTKSVEVNFYRHMRFYNDGQLLYSMSVVDPWDTPFKNMRPVDRIVYVGRYTAVGSIVEVEIDTHYCTIQFTLEILDGNQSYGNYGGKHSILRIISHRQLVDHYTTEFSLPMNCDMRFYRQWNWTPNTFLKS